MKGLVYNTHAKNAQGYAHMYIFCMHGEYVCILDSKGRAKAFYQKVLLLKNPK